MGVLAFALTVLVWPPFYSAATAPRWALLAVAVPVLLLIRPREHVSPYAALLLAIAGVSLLWTSNVFNGLDILFKFSLLAGVFVLARSEDTEKVLIGMGLGLSINSLLLSAQLMPEGATFINRNFLAEAAAPVLVGLLCLRQYLLAVPAVLCLALTGTRGALVGVAAAAIAWFWGRSRVVSVSLFLCLIVTGFVIVASGYRLETIAVRVGVWREALTNLALFGHGLGSVYTDFPGTNHLHNDALELVYELGIGSIAFFAVLVLALQVNMLPERLVLVTILVEGCFGFPLYMPATGFLLAFVAGVLLHQRARLRAHVFEGRTVLSPGGAPGCSVRRRAF